MAFDNPSAGVTGGEFPASNNIEHSDFSVCSASDDFGRRWEELRIENVVGMPEYATVSVDSYLTDGLNAPCGDHGIALKRSVAKFPYTESNAFGGIEIRSKI